MGAIESGGGTSSRQVDPVLWADIHESTELSRAKRVYSISGGGLITHLASKRQWHTTRTVRHALCGQSIRDTRQPSWLPASHPPIDQPEVLCPACLGLIAPYGITTDMLQDRAWWIEHGRLLAGEPLNQERHYVRPRPGLLPHYLQDTHARWSYGQSAKAGAYAVTNHGKAPDGTISLSVSYKGTHLWDEQRRIRPNGASSYITRIETVPRGQFPTDSTLLLLTCIADEDGQATIDHVRNAVFTDLGRHDWPHNCRCILSRDAEGQPFAVTMIEDASIMDTQPAHVEPALAKSRDSGDPNHPDHFVAAALNRRIDEHLRAGGTVTVYGVDGIGYPIVRAYAPKVGRGAEIRIAYRGGETAVAAADLRSHLARDSQRIQMIDADEEPLCIRFD